MTLTLLKLCISETVDEFCEEWLSHQSSPVTSTFLITGGNADPSSTGWVEITKRLNLRCPEVTLRKAGLGNPVGIVHGQSLKPETDCTDKEATKRLLFVTSCPEKIRESGSNRDPKNGSYGSQHGPRTHEKCNNALPGWSVVAFHKRTSPQRHSLRQAYPGRFVQYTMSCCVLGGRSDHPP